MLGHWCCAKLGACTIDNAEISWVHQARGVCERHEEHGQVHSGQLFEFFQHWTRVSWKRTNLRFSLFVHKFSRENTQKKFLDKAFACALLPIVLDNKRAPHLDMFIQYLETLPDNVTISADQWTSFLHFNEVVQLDLTGYDAENGAWPLILDEYVEHLQAKLEKN